MCRPPHVDHRRREHHSEPVLNRLIILPKNETLRLTVCPSPGDGFGQWTRRFCFPGQSRELRVSDAFLRLPGLRARGSLQTSG